MSERLVARLRSYGRDPHEGNALTDAAADRIEELEAAQVPDGHAGLYDHL